MPKTLKNKSRMSKKNGGKRGVASKKRTYKKKNQKKNLVNKKKRKGGAVPEFVAEQEREEPDSDDDEEVAPKGEILSFGKPEDYLRMINEQIQKKKAQPTDNVTSKEGVNYTGEMNKAIASRPSYMKMVDE
jgi:hypothetical protein